MLVKRTTLIENPFFLFFILIFCLLSAFKAGAAWQEIKVFKRVESNGTFSSKKMEAKRECFSRAVFQEVLRILPGVLDSYRQELLYEFLTPKAQNFVLSYSENAFSTKEGWITLDMGIETNAQALKSWLKGMGSYFTVNDKLDYNLNLTGLNATQNLRLAQLEKLAGLNRTSKASRLILKIKKIDRPNGKAWGGKLLADEKSRNLVQENLLDLWTGLWTWYFELPETRQRMEKSLVLEVSGWSTVSGVQGFDGILQSWFYVLDQSKLQRIVVRPGNISGRWAVFCVDVSLLEGKLQDFLKPRGLVYQIRQEDLVSHMKE